jgi:hypothetical protein
MALRGRSTGASESGEAIGAMLAGAATLAWQWPARSVFHVRLEAQLHVRLNEVRFVVEGLGDAHRVPRLAPSFALSVALWP